MKGFTPEQEARLAEVVRREVRAEIVALLEVAARRSTFGESLANSYRLAGFRADLDREKAEASRA